MQNQVLQPLKKVGCRTKVGLIIVSFHFFFWPFSEQSTDAILAAQKQKSAGAHHLDISCRGLVPVV